MAGLAKALEALPPRRGPGGRCAIAAIFERLDDEDTATLRGWLADPDITSAEITAALREDGQTIGPTSVQRHRRRACMCPHG